MEDQTFRGYILKQQFIHDAVPATTSTMLNFQAWFAYAPAVDGSLFIAVWSPSYAALCRKLEECAKV